MFKVEEEFVRNQWGKALYTLRRLPAHAVHYMAGVYLPPHERMWLSIMFSGYRENNIIGSRGTSKSFTHASLGAPIYDLLHNNSHTLVLSASGFRGGKLLFEDIDRLYRGSLRSQEMDEPFLSVSVDGVTRKKVLTRHPDMWYVKHRSDSQTTTVPTNNPDTLRGIRATNVIVDERNTFDGDVVQTVIRPMLNVGKEFRKTAKGINQNKIFQVSTIDYTFRDWYPEIEAQTSLAKREYEAMKALKEGDFREYDTLMEADEAALKGASYSVSRVDYTDLIIPDEVDCITENKVYEVHLPLPDDLTEEDVKIYDQRDDKSYWYLYPVDKDQLEAPLRDGTMDEDLWLAEQRNVFIAASGTVYPHELITKASEFPIYEEGKFPDDVVYDDAFYPPILYKCGDPCVIGADYARESDEFAIVVIRVGPLAEKKFDPNMFESDDKGRPFLGKTPWSNVIWAESWKGLTAQEAAFKLFEMHERYKLLYHPVKGRGIALDKQGGGGAVRDVLAVPPKSRPDLNPIYDPNDEDYAHYHGVRDDAWPGLELIKPTNQTNIDFTMGSKSLLQKGHLYIGYYEAPSKWARKKGLVTATGGVDTGNPLYHAIQVGYLGVKRLKSQLVRLQTKVSESGTIRFIMPGKRESEDGKKDLYSAFTYASHLLRQHIVGLTKDDKKPPTARPVIVNVGAERGRNRRDKDVRSWTKIKYGGL